MVKKRGQISVEWVTLIVFITSLVIPALYFLMQSLEDVKADYDAVRIDGYASELKENAERIYFAGLYSKTTLTPLLSGDRIHIHDVFTVAIFNRTDEKDYFILNITTWQNYNQYLYYPSQVPLRTDNCTPVNDSRYVAECGPVERNCTVCFLDAAEFLYRDLSVEALLKDDSMYVNISYKR